MGACISLLLIKVYDSSNVLTYNIYLTCRAVPLGSK